MNWYVRQGTKPVGPFTEEEIRQRLLNGEILHTELLWSDADQDWRLALQWEVFRKLLVPAFQEFETVSERAEVWTVLKRETLQMSGPWSLHSIRQALKAGELTPQDSIWKKNMTGWAPIALRPENLVPTSGASEIPSRP